MEMEKGQRGDKREGGEKFEESEGDEGGGCGRLVVVIVGK